MQLYRACRILYKLTSQVEFQDGIAYVLSYSVKDSSYLLFFFVPKYVIILRKIQLHFCTKDCTCNLLHKIASSITSISYFRTHRVLLYFEEVMKKLKGSPLQLQKGLRVRLPGNLFVSQFTFRIRIVQLCFLQGIQCM